MPPRISAAGAFVFVAQPPGPTSSGRDRHERPHLRESG